MLAPGGRVVVLDIEHTAAHADVLRAAGLDVDEPTDAGERGWRTGPWMPTHALCARK